MAIVPVMYRAGGSAGSVLKLPIEVQNLDPTPVSITLTLSPVAYTDWTYGPNIGTKTEFDCTAWFQKQQFSAIIQPASHFNFECQCKIPRTTPPGVYYCLGLVDPAPNARNPIRAQYQIPIIIFVGKQPPLNLEFGTPTMELTDKTGSVNVSFTNDSRAFTVIGATVQLRDAVTGRSIATKSDTDRNLYPNSKRTLPFGIGPLPDGQYIVRCTCQAGTRTFRPLQASFVVVKNKAVPATAASLVSLPPVTANPERVHQDMPSGSRRMMAVKFTNQTDSTINLVLTTHRLSQAANGSLQVLDDPPTAPLHVDVEPASISIPPKREATIRIFATLDRGATGDSWFAVSATSTSHDSMSEEVYGSVKVLKTESPKLSIEGKGVALTDNYPMSADYEVTNTGNIALKPLPFAAVLESGLTPVARMDVPTLGDGGILPGATLHNRIMLPLDLKPGAYAVRIEYQYAESPTGERISEVKLIPFTVPQKKAAKTKKGGSP